MTSDLGSSFISKTVERRRYQTASSRCSFYISGPRRAHENSGLCLLLPRDVPELLRLHTVSISRVDNAVFNFRTRSDTCACHIGVQLASLEMTVIKIELRIGFGKGRI